MAFSMKDFAQLYGPLITKEEAREKLGVPNTVDSHNYDPMRMGLVIGDSFISDESIHRGEVLKGEIVDESSEKRLDC